MNYYHKLPLLKSALKALRKDKRKTIINKPLKTNYRVALANARKKPTQKNIDKAFSSLDKAAKKGVIHKNKASRLKSKLSKSLKTKTKLSLVKKTKKHLKS